MKPVDDAGIDQLWGGNFLLLEAPVAHGVLFQEITRIILSHLHYAMAGGIILKKESINDYKTFSPVRGELPS